MAAQLDAAKIRAAIMARLDGADGDARGAREEGDRRVEVHSDVLAAYPAADGRELHAATSCPVARVRSSGL